MAEQYFDFVAQTILPKAMTLEEIMEATNPVLY